jgi:CarD family transcriptional regulator
MGNALDLWQYAGKGAAAPIVRSYSARFASRNARSGWSAARGIALRIAPQTGRGILRRDDTQQILRELNGGTQQAPKRRTVAKPKPRADTHAVVEKPQEPAAPVAPSPEPERTKTPAAAARAGRTAPLQASEPAPAPLHAPPAPPTHAEAETALRRETPAPARAVAPLPQDAAAAPPERPAAATAIAADKPEQPMAAEPTTPASPDDGIAPENDDEEAEPPHPGRNGAVIAFRRPLAAAPPDGPEEEFHEGDHVVYPTHGVGKVERIATEDIAGHRLELIHITFEENRMTLRVPVTKARSAGLRKLASRAQFNEALAVLKGRARIKRTMWSRRAQEYEAKINSGDPLAIAEVVRDLHRNAGQPDQSFSERQIYEAAMDRLAAELAALDQTDKPTAATKLADYLKTTEAAKAP